MSGASEPEALLTAARELLARGSWPRAVAFLCRQALEQSLRSFWQARASGMEDASMHAQLIALAFYTGDLEAGRARQAWAELSRACHHHLDALAPGPAELRSWIDDVAALTQALREASA